MRPEFRLLTADDDLEPELDLTRRAFGSFGSDQREQRLARTRAAASDGRYLAGFDGDRQVASALFWDMRQWWHGRSLPMAGVAGVKVAPEERGRGTGGGLMTGLLEQIARRGYPLAVLYPATSAFYRSVGWEIAGGQYEMTLPARSLRRLQAPDPMTGAGAVPDVAVRRAGPADAARINEVTGEVHAATRACGPVTFDAASLARELDDPNVFCYLADDGFLSYEWSRAHDEILVDCVLAGSAQTSRAWWSILASHGTMADIVRAMVSPADPVTWLVTEPDARLARREAWMLRLVDAPAAIAGRGYPEGADVAARLLMADAQLPANAGEWLLRISAGKGSLTRADAEAGERVEGPEGDGERVDGTGFDSAGFDSAGFDSAGFDSAGESVAGPLRLGSRGLGALYGGTPLVTLRQAGLAAGGDTATDEALDTAFAAQAYMFDYF